MKSNAPIILVDGSSYLYRAFFACPPLTNAANEPTGATFGVINMLKSLLNQYNPSHIAVVFDAKGGSFRHQLYSEYKATREAMPDDLVKQIEPIHTIIKAMGLPLLCVEGVEADDVIGTLAIEAASKGESVLISTGDKDMAQLVNEHITLINTMNNQILDPNAVIEKFGIPPAQIIDYLALMGDKSDNIPGVPGVGEKTAVALLNHFSGISDIYARIDEVAELSIRGAKSLKEKLFNNRADAELSYQLATIKTDLNLDIKADKLDIQPIDMAEINRLFEYNGFKRWLIELEHKKFIPSQTDNENSSVQQQIEVKQVATGLTKIANGYQTILTESALDEWLTQLSRCQQFAFDTETTSLDHNNAQLVGLSFCIEPGKAAYIPVGHDYIDVPDQLPLNEVISKLKPLLENENILKIGQNLKYDCSVMANYGIDVKAIAFDTMLESYILDSNGRHNMDIMAEKHLNHKTITYDQLTKLGTKKLPISQIDVESTTQYAAEDADVTLQLHQTLWPKIEQDKRLQQVFTKIEMPLVPVLVKMERTGVLIDVPLLNNHSNELAIALQKLEQAMFISAGKEFNPNSPKQLQKILFEENNLPVLKKTPKGDASTSEEVLIELAHEFELPQLILEYRGLAKLKNTYTDKLPLMVDPKDQRIHTNYNQTGTVTGRLSSNDPNLQNIPVRNEEGRKIRQAFIAPKGYKIISADYSQIELRIMAHLSRDKALLDAFSQDKDIHRFTAAETLDISEDSVTSEQRRNAKAVNFGLIYGMSAFGLAKQLAIPRQNAQNYIDRYFKRYPGVGIYMEETRQQAIEKGYVETVSGRRLYLPSIKSSRALERKGAERAAINAPMQGTAADIIKTAMIKIAKWIDSTQNDEIRMLMQVHDELVFEVKEDKVDAIKQQIKQIMENCYQLSVPLKVDIGVGNNWDEAH
ncbi:DNA polymerase I [Utexia brackfieldae]|uniref:DNA polymerase I n=1 Tax=Utexia brackfieldae TaxID=3074108 RepID=UPI00370D8203